MWHVAWAESAPTADSETATGGDVHGTAMQSMPQPRARLGTDAEQGIHEKCMNVLAQLQEPSSKHAAMFYVNVEKKDGTAQQQRGSCMACTTNVVSTGAYRFHSHLLVCPLMPASVKKAFKDLRDSTESKRAAKREREAVIDTEIQLAAQEQKARNQLLKQQCIRAGFKECSIAAADKAIAKFFYGNAIPFNAASQQSNSLYRRMISAIQAAPSGYVPPNSSKLSNQLLDECHDDMWKEISARDPDNTLATKFGSTYVADGWDSCDNLPLINSAFITANDGGVFWRSVDTSGHTKDADYCAALMIQDIYDFGPLKVVAVVTDTCAVMQKRADSRGG